MATITGKDGAASIGGSAVNGKVLGWKLGFSSKNVETTGAGDSVIERVHLAKDWKAEIEFEAIDQASWDQHQSLVGTSATVSLKRKSADTNPYATGTGLVTDVSLDLPSDNAVKTTITVECNGTDLTLDTTPAT